MFHVLCGFDGEHRAWRARMQGFWAVGCLIVIFHHVWSKTVHGSSNEVVDTVCRNADPRALVQPGVDKVEELLGQRRLLALRTNDLGMTGSRIILRMDLSTTSTARRYRRRVQSADDLATCRSVSTLVDAVILWRRLEAIQIF